MNPPRMYILILLVAGMLAAAWYAPAQPAEGPEAETAEETPAPPEDPQSFEGRMAALERAEREAQARLETVSAATEIAEDVRAVLAEKYAQAMAEYRAARDWLAKTEAFAREAAPPEPEAETEAATEAPVEEPDMGDPSTIPLADLERFLDTLKEQLDESRERQNALDTELNQRGERRQELPELIAQAQERLEAAAAEAGQTPPADMPPARAQAQQMWAEARLRAVENELQALKTELQTFDARGRALLDRQQETARRVSELATRLEGLQQVAVVRRIQEAEAAEEQARRAALESASAAPEVRDYAELLAAENRELTERRGGPDGILAEHARVERELEQVEEANEAIEQEHAQAVEREKTGRSNYAFGLLLQRARTGLPDGELLRRRVREIQREIDRLNAELTELEARRQVLADPGAIAEEVLAASGDALTDDELERLRDLLTDLLEAQRAHIDSLITDGNRLFFALSDLLSEEQSLLRTLDAFSAYIDERVLWVRSSDVLRWRDAAHAADALRWLAYAPHWRMLPRALIERAREVPIQVGLVGVFFLATLGFRRRLTRQLREFGERAEKSTCTSFRPTVEALVATLLLAAPAGLLVWFTGTQLEAWRAAESPPWSEAVEAPSTSLLRETPTADGAVSRVDPVDFVPVAGRGLVAIGLTLLAFGTVRQLIRPKGLAESHFDWPSAQLRALRRHLLGLMPVLGLSLAITYGLEAQPVEAWRHSLGRLAFVVAMGALVVFAHRTLRPRGGALLELLELRLFQKKSRLRPLWHLAGVGVPLALAILALTGYYYTALRLGVRFYATLCVAMAALTVAALVLRWVFVMRRGVAIEQARRKRAAAKEKEGTEAAAVVVEEEHELDVARIGVQTRRLIRATVGFGFVIGLWLAWASELPALGVLDELPLWSGAAITAADLLLALLVGVMTVVAVANLPGFLEISVLQRLSLGSGERYAIRTLTGYALGIVGIVLALYALGVTWNKLQWLVAAVSVGLGFGLQEIFANFISGLIILFERPIRVGDTVTIGDISGTVTRIRIRATSIMGFDRKELIVPNKEFVTGQLINWTLSDNTLRIVIPVAVPHGTDASRVLRILERVARSTENVMEDPAPIILFSGFGEGTLKFELRAYCPDLESFLQVQHDLFMGVNEAFARENISLAAPRRDLHVRSVPGSVSGLSGLIGRRSPES